MASCAAIGRVEATGDDKVSRHDLLGGHFYRIGGCRRCICGHERAEHRQPWWPPPSLSSWLVFHPLSIRARSRAPASRVKIKQMSDGVEDFCLTELNVMTANLSRQVMRWGDGGAGHSEARTPANEVFQSRKKHVAQRDECVLVPLCNTYLSVQFMSHLRLPVPPL